MAAAWQEAQSWVLGGERHKPLGALELGRGRQRPVKQPCGRSLLMAVYLSFVAASVQESFQSRELSAACCLVLYLSPSAPSLSLPVSGVAFHSSHSRTVTTLNLPTLPPSLGLSGLCFTPLLALHLLLVHRLSFAPFHFLLVPRTVGSSRNPPSAEPGGVQATAPPGVLDPASIAPQS